MHPHLFRHAAPCLFTTPLPLPAGLKGGENGQSIALGTQSSSRLMVPISRMSPCRALGGKSCTPSHSPLQTKRGGGIPRHRWQDWKSTVLFRTCTALLFLSEGAEAASPTLLSAGLAPFKHHTESTGEGPRHSNFGKSHSYAAAFTGFSPQSCSECDHTFWGIINLSLCCNSRLHH